MCESRTNPVETLEKKFLPFLIYLSAQSMDFQELNSVGPPGRNVRGNNSDREIHGLDRSALGAKFWLSNHARIRQMIRKLICIVSLLICLATPVASRSAALENS